MSAIGNISKRIGNLDDSHGRPCIISSLSLALSHAAPGRTVGTKRASLSWTPSKLGWLALSLTCRQPYPTPAASQSSAPPKPSSEPSVAHSLKPGAVPRQGRELTVGSAFQPAAHLGLLFPRGLLTGRGRSAWAKQKEEQPFRFNAPVPAHGA